MENVIIFQYFEYYDPPGPAEQRIKLVSGIAPSSSSGSRDNTDIVREKENVSNISEEIENGASNPGSHIDSDQCHYKNDLTSYEEDNATEVVTERLQQRIELRSSLHQKYLSSKSLNNEKCQ